MLLRRITHHVRDQNWFAVGLDFLIVVVGVFIGIQVANWNQELREQGLQQTSMASLREDFHASLYELQQREASLIEIIEAMRTLLEMESDGATPPDVDHLNSLFKNIHAMPAFHWTSRTYDNLIGAGEMRLIENPEIANALAKFETQIRLTELVQATHEQELVETFQPWIIQNMDYLAVYYDRTDGAYPLPPASEPARIVELLGNREFRNVLVQKWTISTDLLKLNQELQNQSRRLLELLDKELES